MEILNSIYRDEKLILKNKQRMIKANSRLKLKTLAGEIDLEFIHTTHSTIQCVFPVWHSKEGGIFYTLDFKFDKHPIIGEPPNYSRLKELGRKKTNKMPCC